MANTTAFPNSVELLKGESLALDVICTLPAPLPSAAALWSALAAACSHLTCPCCWSLLHFTAIYPHLFLGWTAHTHTDPAPPLTSNSLWGSLPCCCLQLSTTCSDLLLMPPVPFHQAAVGWPLSARLSPNRRSAPRISITYLSCWPTTRSLPLLVAESTFYMWGMGAGARWLVRP